MTRNTQDERDEAQLSLYNGESSTQFKTMFHHHCCFDNLPPHFALLDSPDFRESFSITHITQFLRTICYIYVFIHCPHTHTSHWLSISSSFWSNKPTWGRAVFTRGKEGNTQRLMNEENPANLYCISFIAKMCNGFGDWERGGK